MSSTTGPISTLPGHPHDLPEGTVCDDHPDRLAVARIQGETDSFGCETHDMCQECLDRYRNRDRTEERTGMCDWCKRPAIDLAKRRDYEEGLSGPVYDVCGACRAKENAAIQEEYDQNEYDFF